MENEKYLEIAHQNLKDTIKNRIKNIKTARMKETKDYLLFTIGVDTEDGHLNGCLAFNDDAYEETFEAAQQFFKELGFSYSFWIRDGLDLKLENLLEEKGYGASRYPGSSIMYTEKRIEVPRLSDDFQLKKMTRPNEIADLAHVIKEAFGKKEAVIDRMFSSIDNLYSEDFKSFLIYDKNGEAVSTAITSLTDDSAGIYYVSTLEKARSKGLGKVITAAASNIAFDYGREIVILQASSLGEIVYNKLNFQKTGTYRSYKIK